MQWFLLFSCIVSVTTVRPRYFTGPYSHFRKSTPLISWCPKFYFADWEKELAFIMASFLFLLESTDFPLIDPYGPRYTLNVLHTLQCMRRTCFPKSAWQACSSRHCSRGPQAREEWEAERTGGLCTWVCDNSSSIPGTSPPGMGHVLRPSLTSSPECQRLNEANILLHSVQCASPPLTAFSSQNTGHLLKYYKLLRCLFSVPATHLTLLNCDVSCARAGTAIWFVCWCSPSTRNTPWCMGGAQNLFGK